MDLFPGCTVPVPRRLRRRVLVHPADDDRDMTDRLEKIDARIDSLRVKLENAIQRKRVKTQLRQQQREAKIQALQAKANQTQGANRRRQEARIADLRREYEDKAAGS